MQISMIGIDYNKAPVDIRALFSFTKKSAGEAMQELKKRQDILGCIILSTCNRMEIWVSSTCHEGMEESEFDPWELYEFLCEYKKLDINNYAQYFTVRSDKQAVEHLFYLTSGLKSQIIAEDQIVTQVKDALSLAREFYCSDSILEVLFRTAVTAAKRVKTEVVFSRANMSVMHQALHMLEREGCKVAGKKCMVIGNGEMGKVAAGALRDAGADVTVTIRQYHRGQVTVPDGCDMIHYSERMALFPWCDLIVSATASPNFTITKELFDEVELEHDIRLVDLAVPRDIDPLISQNEKVTLYNIDSFKTDCSDETLSESFEAAAAILNEEMEEFYTWLAGRDMLPGIIRIKSAAAEDMKQRVVHTVKTGKVCGEDKAAYEEAIECSAAKVVGKLLFGIRDKVGVKEFEACIEGLEKLYGTK